MTSKSVYQIDPHNFSIIKRYEKITDAEKDDFHQNGIGNVINSANTYKGYLFYEVCKYDEKRVKEDYELRQLEIKKNMGNNRPYINPETETNKRNIAILDDKKQKLNYKIINEEKLYKKVIKNDTDITFICSNNHTITVKFSKFKKDNYECDECNNPIEERNNILKKIGLKISSVKNGMNSHNRTKCFIYECTTCGKIFDNYVYETLRNYINNNKYEKDKKYICC